MILLLILLNGVFAMAEFAIVTARKNRLQQKADQGDQGAKAALDLARDPANFLATVQIGITLVGILAGAFGGATIAQFIAAELGKWRALAPYSQAISVGLVVILITGLSLVFGELVPKRLALIRPESLASALAKPMSRLARWMSPLVRLLGFISDSIMKAARVSTPDEPAITEEDLKLLITQAAMAGVILEVEQDLVSGIFRLSDRRAGTLITPRPEIEWLDLNDPLEENLKKIRESVHSSFPVAHGALDNVVGIVTTKNLLACYLGDTASPKLENCMTPPVFVPENTPALKVFEIFKSTRPHLVLVIDEYGGLQGLLTIRDILEAFIGDIHLRDSSGDLYIVPRADGTWLVDGMLPVDEFMEALQVTAIPEYERGYYETVGGFVMNQLGKIPSTGDRFDWGDFTFEVVDMDGMRVDKVLVSKTGDAALPISSSVDNL